MLVGDAIAWVAAGLVLVPFATLFIEIVAAILPARRPVLPAISPSIAVLIPAHDEEAGVAKTIATIQTQLGPHDRIIVIADNCSDQTAHVARATGVEVIERHEPNQRGKGFALDFGLKYVGANPSEVVVVIDADTMVHPGAIKSLAQAAAATSCPIQGVNLLDAPPNSGPSARISAFAFYFKNYIRPRGLDRLGLPCLLYGTGMALPFELIAKADLAHGDITEDIRLGLDLALAGRAPQFCQNAYVSGEFPTSERAAKTQRRRWEHGHIRTLLHHVPRLLMAGVFRGQLKLIALALHIGVPPLSLLFLFGTMAAGVLAILGYHWQSAAVITGIALALVAALLAWACLGRDRLPIRDLLLLPVYVVKKIPLYLTFLFRPQRAWVRTERTRPGESQ